TNNIFLSGQFTDNFGGIGWIKLKPEPSARERGKHLRQSVRPGPLIRLPGKLLDARIPKDAQERRGIPITFHRSSRSRRTAAAIVSRDGRIPSGGCKRPFTRRGRTMMDSAETTFVRTIFPSVEISTLKTSPDFAVGRRIRFFVSALTVIGA